MAIHEAAKSRFQKRRGPRVRTEQRSSSGPSERRRGRRLRLESLEPRQLLSVNTELISTTPSGEAAGRSFIYDDISQQAISGDGRYIAFTSDANNLVTGVNVIANTNNVYRYDRLTGHMDLVSIDFTGSGSGNGSSTEPAISADGSVVAFKSYASNLNPRDSDGYADIFVHNFNTGATQLVSVDESGTSGGRAGSYAPAISANGNVVAFGSYSSILNSLDTDSHFDLFARNLATGITQLITVNSAGTGPSNDTYDSYTPVLSADGNVVAFESAASDISPLDTDIDTDVFARDLTTNTTYLVSINATGTSSGNSNSANPTVSADGRYIAFVSEASDLDPTDQDIAGGESRSDAFVRDIGTNVTHLISVNASGTDSGNYETNNAVISANGNVVAFWSSATDLLPVPANHSGLYARNLITGKTYLVSVSSHGVAGDNGGWDPVVSADGSMIAFVSESQNLAKLDANKHDDIFVHNLLSGTTSLVSVNHEGTNGGNNNSRDAIISADGTVVAFATYASDLAAVDLNGEQDVLAAVVAPPPATILTVDTFADEADGDYSPGHFSLREAVAVANARTGPDTIQFSRDLLANGPAVLALTRGELTITDAVTIEGQGDDLLTIDVQNHSRILNISAAAADVTVRGIAFKGGETDGSGVNANDSTFAGGAIHSSSTAKLNIVSCTICSSKTTGDFAAGGAIFSLGPLDITSSLIDDCSTRGSTSFGGAIFCNAALALVDSTISNNSTQGEHASGGGIYSIHQTTLSKSTISGNRSLRADGGGISAVGPVNASDCIVTGNRSAAEGGGIKVEGAANFSNSLVSSNKTDGNDGGGGGIWSSGDVVLVDGSVRDNQTTGDRSHGGGIHSAGKITITDTSIVSNSTLGIDAAGGGISGDDVVIRSSTVSGNNTYGNGAYGGGIRANSLELTESTVSGNNTRGRSADGAGIWIYGDSSIIQSTITANNAADASAMGGGIWIGTGPVSTPPQTLTISGTILAGNMAAGGAPDLRATQIVSARYSLIGDRNGTSLSEAPVGTPDLNGNLIGGSINGSINPRLAPLADNGGPTQTYELLPNSPAIDHGAPSYVANVVGNSVYDQRGSAFIRIVDGDADTVPRVDIGAVEQGALHLTVTTDQDTIDYGDGLLSLREAILATNASPQPDTIDFDLAHPGPSTITLQRGEFAINGAVTIDGPRSTLLTIDAHQQSRVFNITADSDDVMLCGLTLTNGKIFSDNVQNPTSGVYPLDSNGGALRSATTGSVTLEDVTVKNSSTTGSQATGGGISALGLLVLNDCKIIGNSTTGESSEGGGIFAWHGLTLNHTTVAENHTTGDGAYGGGISTGGFELTTNIIDSTIQDNTSNSIGGGISAFGTLQVTRSTISGNTSTGNVAHGGGIYASTIAVTDSTITGNSAIGANANGGGIHVSQLARITGSIITHNSAGFMGGGVQVAWPTSAYALFMTNCVITDNSAGYQGGGLQVPGGISIDGCVVSRNSVAGFSGGVGGGLRSYNVIVKDSLFQGNSAPGSGAIYCSDFTVNNSSFIGNHALSGSGGAVFSDGGGTVANSTISGNSAVVDGGLSISHTLTIVNSTITNNYASNIGGGVHASSSSTIKSSIVAGNSAVNGKPDLRLDGSATLKYSIIGDKSGTTLVESHTADVNGNLIGNSAGAGTINPMIGALANYGGKILPDGSPMLTHALLAGSPAIDRGDPTFNPADPDGISWTPDATPFDGRGAPFARISGGRMDTGAFEIQKSPALVGDYNLDSIVDAGDYVLWRRTLGSSVVAFSGADGNGNGVIDGGDFDIMRSHFGQVRGNSASNTEMGMTASDAERNPVVGSSTSSQIDRNKNSPILASASLAEYAPNLMSSAIMQFAKHRTIGAYFAEDRLIRISPDVQDTALLEWLFERSTNNSTSTNSMCRYVRMKDGSIVVVGIEQNTQSENQNELTSTLHRARFAGL